VLTGQMFYKLIGGKNGVFDSKCSRKRNQNIGFNKNFTEELIQIAKNSDHK
jgi:hypothetical protein